LDGFFDYICVVWTFLHKTPKEERMLEGDLWIIKMVFGRYVTSRLVKLAKEMVTKALVYNGFIKAIVKDREDVRP